jgi:hypothetical protein
VAARAGGLVAAREVSWVAVRGGGLGGDARRRLSWSAARGRGGRPFLREGVPREMDSL